MLLATGLWFAHALPDERNAEVAVYIEYTGIPDDIGWVGEGLPTTLTATVTDQVEQLRTYRDNGLHISLDLATQFRNPRGTVRVSSDALWRAVKSDLENTSYLRKLEPDRLSCAYYHLEERQVPIVWQGDIDLAPEYQLVDSLRFSHTYVTLYGRSEQIDTIRAIATEAIYIEGVRDTVVASVPLVAPPGVRLSVDSITLTLFSERFTEKKFSRVPLYVAGVPEGESVRLFPQEVEVVVRVGVLYFATITQHDIVAQCHYPADPNVDKLEVEVTFANPHISHARVTPNEVEFIIEKKE